MSNSKQNDIVIDFIDPLFAVVLHISFVDLKATHWFSDFRLIFIEPYSFHLMTLILVYLTMVLSWIGYHRSIKNNPINVEKTWGRCRFGLDIVLLIFYFILVASYENFRRELWVLFAIFVIFVFWDQAKRKEIPETSLDSTARRGVTVLWGFVFLCLAILSIWTSVDGSHSCKDWFILTAAILSTIFYRWHKERLGWRPLLLKLGYPKAHV